LGDGRTRRVSALEKLLFREQPSARRADAVVSPLVPVPRSGGRRSLESDLGTWGKKMSVETEDTRTRLREAALELLGRQGVRGTSTRAILDAAGVRNPSALTYYFGSKAALVQDLVEELTNEAWPILRLQAERTAGSVPTVREWAAVAADSAVELLATERGCLLACLWWEYDCFLHPDALEELLAGDDRLAVDWRAAVRATFPGKPPLIAVAQNVVAIRTLQWLVARRARKLLTDRPSPTIRVKKPEDVREALIDVSMALLTGPTRLTDDDMLFQ
jgi:AcrR family transcriptional regulator